jgi:hypothetical protein
MIIPQVLIKNTRLGSGEKIAFALLLSLAPPGRYCEAFYTALAGPMGVCGIQTRRRVRGLQDAGLIDISRDDYTFGWEVLDTQLARDCHAAIENAKGA